MPPPDSPAYGLSDSDRSRDGDPEYFGHASKRLEWQNSLRQQGLPFRVTTPFGFSMKYVSLALVSLRRRALYQYTVADKPAACFTELDTYCGTSSQLCGPCTQSS
jgi:hypothetical protein